MNARQTNALALGGGALALLVCVFAVLHTSTNAWRLHQQIITAEQDQSPHDDAQALPQRYLVQAPSHGAAGAALLTRLRSSARLAGVSLERTEPRPADPSDPHNLSISAQASGSTQAIAAFLYEIEAKAPALTVKRARLSSEDGTTVSLDILLTARASYQRSAP